MLSRKPMDQSNHSEDESRVGTRHSMAMFEKVFRRSPEPITISRARDGIFIDVNQAFERISGYSREEVIGRSSLELGLWGEGIDRRNVLLKNIRNRGSIREFEIAFRTKDGSLREGRISGEVFDQEGEDCLLLINRDVTEQRDVQQALRRSEEQYRGIFEATTDGFVLRESDGAIVAVNTAMATMYGYSREEYMKLTVADLMPPEMLPVFKEFRKTIAEGGHFHREAKALHRDGRIFDVEIHGTQFQFRGKPHTLTIARDITERKRAEQNTRDLARIVEWSLNEIYVFDAETFRFLQVNYGARQNLGYTDIELMKLTPIDIKPEFTSESFAQLVDPVRNGTKDGTVFETVHKRKDGSSYNVEVHLQLSELVGRPVLVAIILDITERKRAEDQLIRLNEQLLTERTALDQKNIALKEILGHMEAEKALQESEKKCRNQKLLK